MYALSWILLVAAVVGILSFPFVDLQAIRARKAARVVEAKKRSDAKFIEDLKAAPATPVTYRERFREISNLETGPTSTICQVCLGVDGCANWCPDRFRVGKHIVPESTDPYTGAGAETLSTVDDATGVIVDATADEVVFVDPDPTGDVDTNPTGPMSRPARRAMNRRLPVDPFADPVEVVALKSGHWADDEATPLHDEVAGSPSWDINTGTMRQYLEQSNGPRAIEAAER
jgi:hypothetical protein